MCATASVARGHDDLPLRPGSYNNPRRPLRKLLLHKAEIRKLLGAPRRRADDRAAGGLLQGRLAKIAIALARAKKAHDKREDLKKRVAEREMARVTKGRRE